MAVSASTVITLGCTSRMPATKMKLLFAACAGRNDAHRSGPDAGDQRGVARIDAKLARLAREHDELGLAGGYRLFGADDVDVNGVCQAGLLLLRARSARCCSSSAPPQRCAVAEGSADDFAFLEGLLDRPDHVERLLEGVALAVHDHLEALDRFGERHVLARAAGEVLRHVNGCERKRWILRARATRELVLGESSMPRIAMMSRSSL